jgi:hypothetical protein
MNIKAFQKIFEEEWQKFRTQKEKDTAFIEKSNTETEKPVPTFEEDPIGYILYSYPTLKDSLETLLTKDFLDYVTGIYVIAPIPTTFKVILHNNQFFYMIYMGRTWMAKVSGKKYYLLNVGERGRATEAIARLLTMGAPLGLEPSGAASENMTGESPLPSEGSNPFANTGGETGDKETPPPAEGTGATPLAESKKKILLEIGKKYPTAFRIALKQVLLLEGTVGQNTQKVIQRILTSPENEEYGLKSMVKTGRIANPNKISADQFLELLQKLYPEAEIKVIPPKTPPNIGNYGSSKFNMYTFDTEFGPVGVILALGMNKGEKYEKDFVNKMKANAGKKLTDIDDKELVQLYDYLEIDPSTLKEDDIVEAGKTDTKRSINFEKPENVGSKIADIIVKYNGQEYNISLKDPKGDYVYNGGNVKFIKQNPEGNIYFDEETFIKDNSPTKEIFEILNINPQRLANGLENYVKKEGVPSQWETITDYDGTKLEKMLASSYGYGYYYVRQVRPGELYIKDINSENDVTQLIGQISSVKIKYPSIASKSCEVKVETNSPEGGTNIYQVELRNSSGGVLPSIKVKSIGTKS